MIRRWWQFFRWSRQSGGWRVVRRQNGTCEVRWSVPYGADWYFYLPDQWSDYHEALCAVQQLNGRRLRPAELAPCRELFPGPLST